LAYKIGLTGNIGCGKTTVGEMLRELGADYVDADQLVHELLGAGSPIVDQVATRFGTDLVKADGSIDRRRLGAMVFADAAALRQLEALLHPAVRVVVRRRMAEATAPAIVVDAIKLIESGLYKEMNSVWVVTCESADQQRRLIQLRGLTVEEIRARVAAQPPQADKLPFADVVIDNSGAPEATRRQVIAAWERSVGANIRP
jgi:dephospho-CoA kinase